MSREREPAQLHPSKSGTLDVDALEAVQREVEARARRWVVQLAARLATWLGLPIAGATGGYMVARPEPAPVHREQPASGPEPLPSHPPSECTPSEQRELVEAQDRASRDARTAVDGCAEMARKCDTTRNRDP